MSGWLTQAAGEVSRAVDAEFGTEALVVHMITSPNSRAKPDPLRPQYCVQGVYHEARKPMGGGRMDRDGLHVTWLTSMIATFSAERAAFKWPPTQGDLLYLPEINRGFRITDISYEMATRHQLTLENLEAPPAA